MQRQQQIRSSPEQTISRLNHIHKLLTTIPLPYSPLTHLKEYIAIFLQNKSQNEQYFSLLCEHDILSILFNVKNMKNAVIPMSIDTLQVFNLLFTNINLSTELGYLLSQHALHYGLFVKAFEIKDTQFNQYYCQILKSIVIKISQPSNHSLITLFYNSKYPSFPLMVSCTLMAFNNSQQLVRVTSKQCILIMIKLLKIRNMHSYLSELPMVMFYSKLVSDKQLLNQSGQIGYLTDLLWEVSCNMIACLSILNSILNTIILPNLRNPYIILRFIRNFIKSLKTPQQDLNQQEIRNRQKLADVLQIVYLKIIFKFIFGKYVKCQYLSAQINTKITNHSLDSPSNQVIIKRLHQAAFKTFKQSSKANIVSIYKIPSNIQFFYNIEDAYRHDRQFFKMKEQYIRGHTEKSLPSIYSSIRKRISEDYFYNNYIHQISNSIGFKLQHNPHITINNFIQHIIPNYSLFTTQYFMHVTKQFKKQQVPIEQQQINFNQIKQQLKMIQPFINELCLLLTKLQGNNDAQIFKKQVKQYIQGNIYIHFDKELGRCVASIKAFLKLCKIIHVRLIPYCMNFTLQTLNSLHKEIQEQIFHNGLKIITQNVILDYLIEQNLQILKDRNLIKIHLYECICQIISPQNQLTLKQVILDCLSRKELPEVFQLGVINHQNLQSKLTLTISAKPSVELTITTNGQIIHNLNLLIASNQYNKIHTNPLTINFGGNSKPIKLKQQKDKLSLAETIEKFIYLIQQSVSEGILEYLEQSITFVMKKEKNIKNNENKYMTPH